MNWRIYLYMAGAGLFPFIPACWRPNRGAMTAPSLVEGVKAAAGWDPLTLYFVVGLLVIVAGVVSLVFGGKSTGCLLFACGAGIAHFGQTLAHYPFLSLVVVVVALASFLFDMYSANRRLRGAESSLTDYGKATEYLARTIEAVPGGEDVKAGLRDLGPDAVSAVKKVIAPIKEALAKEGEIRTSQSTA